MKYVQLPEHSKASMNYYIYKIHNFNLPYVRFLNFFKIKVIFHQNTLDSKKRLPLNCRQVDDYQCPDDWIDCLEKSFLEVSLFFENNKIDSPILPRSIADMFARRYEDLKCFKHLCLSDRDFKMAESVICIPFYTESKFFNSLSLSKNMFTFLDSLNEVKVNFISNLKHIFAVLNSFRFISRKLKIKNIISGISSTEMPTSKNSLNAFWLTDDEIANPSETVYFYPALSKLGNIPKSVVVMNNVCICTEISIKNRLLILISKILCTIRSIFCLKIEKFFVLNNKFTVQLWTKFHAAVSIRNYITNISDLWPCSANIEVLSDLGVNTILWSYSYYGSRASMHKRFSGKCLNLSFASFNNVFLWDQKLIDLFKSCEINPGKKEFKKNYFVSGPTIHSTIKHLELSRDQALEELNLSSLKNKTIISAFDLPSWKNDIRRNLGIGLFTTMNAQDSFYKGIYEFIQNNENIVVLIKSKRKSNKVEMSHWFKRLVAEQGGGKLFFIDESISPILLVKASDVVFTIPFTSPSMIAEICGINNIYFDPSRTFNYISISNNDIVKILPPDFLSDLIRSDQKTNSGSDFAGALKKILNTN